MRAPPAAGFRPLVGGFCVRLLSFLIIHRLRKGVSMQRQSAFTLIELMVTIAIIAILAGVALPSYTQYVVRGKLLEGISNLQAMRTKMELYYQDNRSFVGACAAGTVAQLPPPANAGDPPGTLKHFNITCPPGDLSATTYKVQAEGKGGDLAGLVLTIDQANVRRTVSVPSGWTMPATNCWVTKKNGQC
jgi:type IV pilus assembly protein PilE